MKNAIKLGSLLFVSALFVSAPAFAGEHHHHGRISTNAHGNDTTSPFGPSAGSSPGARPMISSMTGNVALPASPNRPGTAFSSNMGLSSGSHPGSRPMTYHMGNAGTYSQR